MNRRRAALFDWRGTLAHCPPPRWWAERALSSIDRPVTAGALEEAGDLPEIDSSAELHREATLGVFARHGLGGELAEALYGLDADPANLRRCLGSVVRARVPEAGCAWRSLPRRPRRRGSGPGRAQAN